MSDKMNPQQKKAVEYNKGPLLIVAGAGTGKTTVLVEKIKYLILKQKVDPKEILALTFTEKAAAEMEQRVDEALPYGLFQMWISTFHSFADQLLRTQIGHIGIDPGYKLMTDAETISFLKRHIFEFNLNYFRPLGNPNKFLHALIQHFDRLRDEDVNPHQYETFSKTLVTKPEVTDEEKLKIEELAAAYKKYQDLKSKHGKLDFADLIFQLLTLLTKRPHLLEEYKKQFKYVLIDEFQDTNIAQYLLIKLLAPPGPDTKLTVVGDDSQAIYKFRGASVSNILQFMKDYPDAESVTLNRNYRSNQVLLDYSYRLIRHNDPDTLEAQLGISKELKGIKKGNQIESLQLYIVETGDEEAEYVAKSILKISQEEGVKFSDIAILVRANKHAEPVISSMSRMGIPYKIWGKSALYKQPEVKDLISYLKVLHDPYDSAAFYRVLTMNIFGIDHHDISLLLGFAKKTALPLSQTPEIYASFFNNDWYLPQYDIYRPYLPLFSEKTKAALMKITSMFRRHQNLLKSHTAGQILYFFLEDTGYLKRITSYTTAADEKIAINISQFFNKLKTMEASQDDNSVAAIVDYLEMSMELGESPTTATSDNYEFDAVNVLTVHAAKGLEFPIVFMMSLAHGRFPSYNKREAIPIPQELIKEILPSGDFHTLEERRLFYVALTRAKDRVFLTSAKYYSGGKRQRKISPFVIETMGADEVNKIAMRKRDNTNQLTIFDFKPAEQTASLHTENNSAPDSLTPIAKSLTNFSYSQLESFKICPLQYKYLYILKIPTSVSAAASFGESIHKALQRFYMDFQKDPKVDLDHLLHLYQKLWIPIGYESADDEALRKAKGKEMLEKFYKTFHDPNRSIIAVEKLFKIKVDSDVFITGKIDRIDAGSDGTIEIVDYKTGRKPDEKELKKNLQLSMYAMAATDPGLLNKRIEEVKLTFYYLNDMEKISMNRTAEDLILVKQEVREAAKKIRSSTFPAHVGPWCSFCQFKINCEAWQ